MNLFRSKTNMDQHIMCVTSCQYKDEILSYKSRERLLTLFVIMLREENCGETCLNPIYLRRQPLPCLVLEPNTTPLLIGLPDNIRCLPTEWITISRCNLKLAIYHQPMQQVIRILRRVTKTKNCIWTYHKKGTFGTFSNFHPVCASGMSSNSLITNRKGISILALKKKETTRTITKHAEEINRTIDLMFLDDSQGKIGHSINSKSKHR